MLHSVHQLFFILIIYTYYVCMFDDKKQVSFDYLEKFKSRGIEDHDENRLVSLIIEAPTDHSDLSVIDHKIIEIRKAATLIFFCNQH